MSRPPTDRRPPPSSRRRLQDGREALAPCRRRSRRLGRIGQQIEPCGSLLGATGIVDAREEDRLGSRRIGEHSTNPRRLRFVRRLRSIRCRCGRTLQCACRSLKRQGLANAFGLTAERSLAQATSGVASNGTSRSLANAVCLYLGGRKSLGYEGTGYPDRRETQTRACGARLTRQDRSRPYRVSRLPRGVERMCKSHASFPSPSSDGARACRVRIRFLL
jgi:hypothetical protein